MTNEDLNQRKQQTDVSTNSDVSAIGDNATFERPKHDELFNVIVK